MVLVVVRKNHTPATASGSFLHVSIHALLQLYCRPVIVNWQPTGHILPAKASHRILMKSENVRWKNVHSGI